MVAEEISEQCRPPLEKMRSVLRTILLVSLNSFCSPKALAVASWKGFAALVRALLDAGASIDAAIPMVRYVCIQDRHLLERFVSGFT